MARVALIDVHRAAMRPVDGGSYHLPIALRNGAGKAVQCVVAFGKLLLFGCGGGHDCTARTRCSRSSAFK
jgi:hypothetical protein